MVGTTKNSKKVAKIKNKNELSVSIKYVVAANERFSSYPIAQFQ